MEQRYDISHIYHSSNSTNNEYQVAGVAAQNAPWATIVNVKVAGVGSTAASVSQGRFIHTLVFSICTDKTKAISDVTDEHLSYRNNRVSTASCPEDNLLTLWDGSPPTGKDRS